MFLPLLRRMKLLQSLLFVVCILGVSACQQDTGNQQEEGAVENSFDGVFDRFSSIPEAKAYKADMIRLLTPVEANLVLQFRENLEKVKTDQEFRTFFNHAQTLKTSLGSSLGNRKGAQEAADLSWFNQLTRALILEQVGEQKTYLIGFDYNHLAIVAQETEGTTDDVFIAAVQQCFVGTLNSPAWMAKTDSGHCSRLGTGVHFRLLEDLGKAMSAGDLFKPEILKTRTLIISDLLFAKNYCASHDAVVGEVEKIMKKIDFKPEERTKIETRLAEIKSKKPDLVFDRQDPGYSSIR